MTAELLDVQEVSIPARLVPPEVVTVIPKVAVSVTDIVSSQWLERSIATRIGRLEVRSDEQAVRTRTGTPHARIFEPIVQDIMRLPPLARLEGGDGVGARYTRARAPVHKKGLRNLDHHCQRSPEGVDGPDARACA